MLTYGLRNGRGYTRRAVKLGKVCFHGMLGGDVQGRWWEGECGRMLLGKKRKTLIVSVFFCCAAATESEDRRCDENSLGVMTPKKRGYNLLHEARNSSPFNGIREKKDERMGGVELIRRRASGGPSDGELKRISTMEASA